jgi:hypothetical protein
VVDGVVFVNGDPIPAHRSGAHFTDDTGRELEVQDVCARRAALRRARRPGAARAPETFASRRRALFHARDNRDWSRDSRDWGTVRRAEIRGPAFLLYWSWDFTGSWLELFDPATWAAAVVRWTDRHRDPMTRPLP